MYKGSPNKLIICCRCTVIFGSLSVLLHCNWSITTYNSCYLSYGILIMWVNYCCSFSLWKRLKLLYSTPIPTLHLYIIKCSGFWFSKNYISVSNRKIEVLKIYKFHQHVSQKWWVSLYKPNMTEIQKLNFMLFILCIDCD